MNEEFKTLINKLVNECKGNQAAAAKKMDVSVSFICNTLQGKGPVDPRTITWTKLYRALNSDNPAENAIKTKFAHVPKGSVKLKILEEIHEILENKPQYTSIVQGYINILKQGELCCYIQKPINARFHRPAHCTCCCS